MRKPGPIVTENGNVEFYSIERIIDETMRKRPTVPSSLERLRSKF